MLGHMSKYFSDFWIFIISYIRCTIQNFQTCNRFCCSLYHQRMPKIDGHCSTGSCRHHWVTGVLCGGGKKRLSSLQPPTPPGGCVSSIHAQTIVTLNTSITTPDALIIPVMSKTIPDTQLMSLVDLGSWLVRWLGICGKAPPCCVYHTC